MAVGEKTGTVVADLGPAELRVRGAGGAVARMPAAALWTGTAMRYGAEARAGAARAPGGYAPALPDAVDEEHLVLGAAVFPTSAVLRGLLRHGLARADGAGSGRPARLVLALPGQWGMIRRGAAERAAAGLADAVVTVGSTEAAVAAARAEGAAPHGAPVAVVELWPGRTLGVLVPAGGAAAGEPARCSDGAPAACLEGDGAGDLRAMLAALAAPAFTGPARGPARAVLVLERGGRVRAAPADPRLRRLDGDAVLRGAMLLGAARGGRPEAPAGGSAEPRRAAPRRRG